MLEEILKSLSINFKTYNDVRSAEFSKWCSKIALEHGLNHRALVIKEQLYSWYLTQWKNEVELPYFNENKAFLEIDDPDRFQALFWMYPERIHEYYPMQLLKQLNLEHKFKNKKING